jgi:hypothetical protein
VDVGQDTAGRDGHAAEQLVELLIVANGQLHVVRCQKRQRQANPANAKPTQSQQEEQEGHTCTWRGMILAFLLSRAALPASSRISAHRYSRTAAR